MNDPRPIVRTDLGELVKTALSLYILYIIGSAIFSVAVILIVLVIMACTPTPPEPPGISGADAWSERSKAFDRQCELNEIQRQKDEIESQKKIAALQKYIDTP